MTSVKFSAKMMQSLVALDKSMLTQSKVTVPQLTSMGDEIKTISELADVMGLDKKIAAAYAIQADSSAELKDDAANILFPGIYNAFEDGYEAIQAYADQIAKKNYIEEKRVRVVRNSQGESYFKQPAGSIIVGAGNQPLDALIALKNDVAGYQKVSDKHGNVYYVGNENGQWVVRSGASRQILYHEAGKDGQRQSLYWLNSKVGGSSMKSISDEVEVKKQYSQMTVNKLGKNGHAFHNSNGDYSYPISNVADLKNAIQAFGRSAPEDREKLKAFIKKRAKQLGQAQLIPDNWKDDSTEVETKSKTPVSAMDTTPLDRSPKKNWVENTGQLPPYIRAIAHALIRAGHPTDEAISIALSRIKAWIADPKTTADTKEKASKALAQWEALRAANKARMAAKKAK